MRRNSQQSRIQALCANNPSEPVLVRATADLHVRNGYISKGGSFEGAHNWGANIPQGTIGIIEGKYQGRTLISFEEQGVYVVTDAFSPHEFVVI